MIAAVVVDNGEALLQKCLESLWNQTVRPKIIVCAGPKTNMDLATRYADRVLEAEDGIGKARLKGILAADTEYIVSCDADSIYEKHYCEYALQDLKMGMNFIRAGTILPHELKEPLTIAEMVVTQIIPYEFSLAFNRKAFLTAGLHEKDYSKPRVDISTYLYTEKILVWPDFRMVVWTRLPTYGAKLVEKEYLPGIFFGALPMAIVGGMIGINRIRTGHFFDLDF